jgi:hypothetical protein
MTRFATSLAVVAAAVLVPASGRAGVPAIAFDHLKCYSITQTSPGAQFSFDVTPRDTRFPAETGCRIKPKPTQLCIPAAKTNVTPAPPGAPVGIQAGTFLCYTMICPRPDKQTLSFTDQFGTRDIQARTPNLFCTPVSGGDDQVGSLGSGSFVTASR